MVTARAIVTTETLTSFGWEFGNQAEDSTWVASAA